MQTKLNKYNEEYNLVRNIAPNVQQIHPKRKNITGLVTTCNRLCILGRLSNWERVTCFEKAPKAVYYAEVYQGTTLFYF